jgi:hypothetical protein
VRGVVRSNNNFCVARQATLPQQPRDRLPCLPPLLRFVASLPRVALPSPDHTHYTQLWLPQCVRAYRPVMSSTSALTAPGTVGENHDFRNSPRKTLDRIHLIYLTTRYAIETLILSRSWPRAVGENPGFRWPFLRKQSTLIRRSRSALRLVLLWRCHGRLRLPRRLTAAQGPRTERIKYGFQGVAAVCSADLEAWN